MTVRESRRAGVRRPAEAGPPLPFVAAVSLGLFIASIVVPLLVGDGRGYPRPEAAEAEFRAYLAANADAISYIALFQFASSVPLAVFTASAVARLHALGVRATGPWIGLVGGVLASAALAGSASIQWVLSRTSSADSPELLHALHDLAFVMGGPWYVVALGLLLAGIAVPAAFYGLLPRPVWITGIALALVGELATLTLATNAAAYLIPIARFGVLPWLVAAGALLPRTRRHGHSEAADTPTRGPGSAAIPEGSR